MREAGYKIAEEIERKVAVIPGAVDVHINQQVHTPQIEVDVDRSKADQAGLTQRDVANSMLISLSSSGQMAPNQWLNPVNGVNYQVAVQTPQFRIDSHRCPGPHADHRRATAAARSCSDNLVSDVHRELTTIAGQPLQRAAGLRCLRQRRPARPGRRGGRHRKDHEARPRLPQSGIDRAARAGARP